MISHRNVISNVLQQVTFDSVARKEKRITTQAVMGLLPLSHIYGLVVVSHIGTWRGDGVIVMPKFELEIFLNAIQKFRVGQLIVVGVHHARRSPYLNF